MTDLLTRIRRLEGMPFPELEIKLDNHNLGMAFPNQQTELRKPDDICSFAEIVSHQAKNLYSCKYKKKCDFQEQFGYKDKYCVKYLTKHNYLWDGNDGE